MAIPHCPHLLLKIPAEHGVLTFKGDLKRSYDCNLEAVQIAAKIAASAKLADEVQEIARIALLQKPEDAEIPTKKIASIKLADTVSTKQIDLGTGDPSKTATISSQLSKE